MYYSTSALHSSCKCPTQTGSSGKTTTPLFFVNLTRFPQQKKNQPNSPRDSRSAGCGPASTRPWDSADRCQCHFFVAQWGLCQYVMGPLKTSSRAPKTKRAGWQGLGGNIFVAHGGKIFAISLTSSFPVCFFSEPWKIRRPLQR